MEEAHGHETTPGSREIFARSTAELRSGHRGRPLAQFGTGHGVEEHVNDEVEVIVLGISGSGIVRVDREEHALSAGMLVLIPKGARRATVSTSEDFAYLTVHRRRRPLQIGLRQDG